MYFKITSTCRTIKIISIIKCKLDLNAILEDNSGGGNPALLFVNLFYHQLFVTSVTKTSKTGLLLFLSSGTTSKSETDPKVVYANKGYVGKKIPEKIKNQVHERADRGHPLSEEAEARNRQRTPIRARVEHVFGSMTGSMKCGIIRCVGLLRAQFQLFMLGLVYNMKRYGFELQKLEKLA